MLGFLKDTPFYQKNRKIYLGIAQMVARHFGVVEAVGSNPATQTIKGVYGFVLWTPFIFIERDLK